MIYNLDIKDIRKESKRKIWGKISEFFLFDKNKAITKRC